MKFSVLFWDCDKIPPALIQARAMSRPLRPRCNPTLRKVALWCCGSEVRDAYQDYFISLDEKSLVNDRAAYSYLLLRSCYNFE